MAVAEDSNQTVDMHKMKIYFNPKILKKKFNKNLKIIDLKKYIHPAYLLALPEMKITIDSFQEYFCFLSSHLFLIELLIMTIFVMTTPEKAIFYITVSQFRTKCLKM